MFPAMSTRSVYLQANDRRRTKQPNNRVSTLYHLFHQLAEKTCLEFDDMWCGDLLIKCCCSGPVARRGEARRHVERPYKKKPKQHSLANIQRAFHEAKQSTLFTVEPHRHKLSKAYKVLIREPGGKHRASSSTSRRSRALLLRLLLLRLR